MKANVTSPEAKQVLLQVHQQYGENGKKIPWVQVWKDHPEWAATLNIDPNRPAPGTVYAAYSVIKLGKARWMKHAPTASAPAPNGATPDNSSRVQLIEK